MGDLNRERTRVAELCAGYGGLFLGLQQAGIPVELAWYAEVDPDASAVMAVHHSGVPNVGDITTAQFSAQEPVDILAAGFPCQAVSGAGRQRGAADDRWLWPDVARAVRILRPELFFDENVARLLSIDGGLLFGVILADLDRLGYTTRWVTVGACRVGLAHHRHRVFIAATRDELVAQDRWPVARRAGTTWETAADTLFGVGLAPEWPAAGVVSDGLAWETPVDVCGDTSDVVLLPTPTVAERTNQSPTPGAAVRPPLSGVVQMLPTPGARLGDEQRGAPSQELAASRLDSGRRNLDDAIGTLLPTPRATDGTKGGPNQRGSSGDLMLPSAVQLLPTPTAVHWARNATAERTAPRPTTNTDSWTLADVAHVDRWGRYAAAVARWEAIIGRPAPDPTEPGRNGLRLAPRFVEWLMALPSGHVTDRVGRNAALRILGNGVVPMQATYALSLLLPARGGVPR